MGSNRPEAVIALVCLLHLDDVVEFPRAVEGRRCRTIDAETGPPPFARRSLWAEVDVH